MNDVRIYRRPLPATTRSARREAERETVAHLINEAFGPGARLSHDENGRPYLEGIPGIYISISHSAEECLLAVSNRPVGIDIEAPREQLQRIAAKFLTPAEQSRGPHDIGVLLRYWTAKEAVFKCADIPSLVISEIELTPDLSHATARMEQYEITYIVTRESVTAIAGQRGE